MNPNQIIKKAIKAEKEGNVGDAAQLFLSILKDKPMHLRAIEGGIRCAREAGLQEELGLALKSKVKIAPKNHAAWYELGTLSHRLMKMDQAIHCFEKAVECEPSHVESLMNLALCYSHSGQFVNSVNVFEKFKKLHPMDILPAILLAEYVHANVHAMASNRTAEDLTSEFKDKIFTDKDALSKLLITTEQACEHKVFDELMQFCIENWEPNQITPRFWVTWARAASILGDKKRLSEIVTNFSAWLNDMVSNQTLPEHYTLTDLYMTKARIFHLGGESYKEDLEKAILVDRAKSEHQIQSLDVNYSNQFKRISGDWTDRFEGKDICLLFNGPSLKKVEENLRSFESLDDTRFIVMNDFSVQKEKILNPLQKNADAILMVSSMSFEQKENEIFEELTSAHQPFLITMAPIIGGQKRAQEFFARANQLFYINSRISAVPSSENCLNFEHINSFSLIIPILMTAKPRRIFIFGADGGNSSKEGNVYFDNKSRENADGDVNELYLRRLALEAECVDNILKFQVPITAKVFNVPIPEIYNVCPTSNSNLFEKIDIEAAVDLLGKAPSKDSFENSIQLELN